MGNSAAKQIDDQDDAPSQPGAQPEKKQEQQQPQNQSSKTKVGEVPAVISNASEYQLVVRGEPQNTEFTYAEDVEKFYSQVCVEAPVFQQISRPSIDIVAALDVSGSMNGEKISLVRKSMRRLIRSMTSKDRVCFVTFDSNVRILMPFTAMDETNRKQAFNYINQLQSGTSTNLCGGVVRGVEELLTNRTNDVAAVLLFTDGQANVGLRDTDGIVNEVLKITGTFAKKQNIETWTPNHVVEWLDKIKLGMYSRTFQLNHIDGSILKNDLNEEMLRNDLEVKSLHIGKFLRELQKIRGDGEGEEPQIEGKTNKTGDENKEEDNKVAGFRLHTFGFGSNHNARLLEQLAENFDGMYYFMENEAGIKSGFANCLGGLLSTVAQEIEVNIQFNSECKTVKVHKDNVTVKNGIHSVHFADLQSEEKRHILVSCSLPKKKKAIPDYHLFEATYKYQNTIANVENSGSVQCSVNRSGKIEGLNENVDETKNRDLAAEALREATRLGDARDLVSARNRLQVTIDEIDRSKSCRTMTSQNIRDDLSTALHKIRDERAFTTEGNYYMMQNDMCFRQERACNMSSDFKTQMEYNTNTRVTMNDAWDESDSEDSCALDDYNDRRPPSPLGNVQPKSWKQAPGFLLQGNSNAIDNMSPFLNNAQVVDFDDTDDSDGEVEGFM